MENNDYTNNPNYTIADDVQIGEGTRIVAQKVNIESGTKIGKNCVLAGDEIQIGKNCIFQDESDVRATHVLIGDSCEFHKGVRVLVGEKLDLEYGCILGKNTVLSCVQCKMGKQVFVVENVEFGGGGEREPWAHLEIGDYVFIGGNAHINVNQPVKIGSRAGVGPFSTIYTHGYHYLGFPSAYEPVTIGEKAWLTSHVIVSPGVEIGANSVIASGAVVTKNIPENSFAAGIPAIVKKSSVSEPDQQYVNTFLIDILSRKYLSIIQSKGFHAELVYDRADTGLQILLEQNGLKTLVYYKYQLQKEELLALDTKDLSQIIVLSYEIDLQEIPKMTIFDAQKSTVCGETTIVSEDFRDFLRRHGIKVFTKENFKTITPSSFQKLMEM